MADTIDIVNTFFDNAKASLKSLTDWNNKAADLTALKSELERQKAEHEANGATADAITVSNTLTKVYSSLLEAQNNVKKYQAAYDAAEALYQEKKNTLLSPAEKVQLAAQQDAKTQETIANAKKAEAEAAAQKVKADIESSTASYAQGQSKLILYAGIGFVLVLIAGFFYFKSKTTPAL